MKYRFFDSASTTQCCNTAADLVRRFATEDFGNPASSHAYGQLAAKAIKEARQFFAKVFRVEPSQIIFTGSGTEADNLAIYGVALDALAKKSRDATVAPRVLCSSTEHPAVRKAVQSLGPLGIDARLIPVDPQGQLRRAEFLDLLTPSTLLVSIQQVNNITGAILPVEELAALVKERAPNALFHTDSVQAFGKTRTPAAPSKIDLFSISAHKVKGPKGVGALVVLNKKLLQNGLRPLIWGGEQEGGFRSGTQNAGLIAGFQAAAALLPQAAGPPQEIQNLHNRFRDALKARGMLKSETAPRGAVLWNSPVQAVPHIVSLSVPGYPSGPLAKLLEERGFLISTGSACGSQKAEPDAVLEAMGLPTQICDSAVRVSFSDLNTVEDVEALVAAFDESIQLMNKLLGGRQ